MKRNKSNNHKANSKKKRKPFVRFKGKGRGNTYGKNYYCFVLRNDNDELKYIPISYEEYARKPKAVITKIAAAGYDLPADIKALLDELEEQREGAKVSIIVAERVGWVDDECLQFVLPDKVYGEGDQPIVFIGSNTPLPLHEYFVTCRLKEWQDKVASKCTGNSRLIWAICLPIAAFLARLLGIESGGFQIVCESSKGKTTMMCVSSSVAGSPVDSWLTTDNALDKKAGLRCDTLLYLDEARLAAEKNPSDVARLILKAVHRLAGGQGKDRFNQDRQDGWKVLYLSTSEHPLDALAREAGIKVDIGQHVRCTDIQGDAGKGMGLFENLHDFNDAGMFADALKAAAEKYRGAAADAFLKRLTEELAEDKEKVLAWLNERMDYYLETAGISGNYGPEHRVGKRFAATYAAGCLAAKYEILPWEMTEIYAAVKSCHDSIFPLVSGEDFTLDQEEMIEHVKDYIESNKDEFVDLRNGKQKPDKDVLKKSGGIHKEPDGKTEYVFDSDFFRTTVCHGLSTGRVVTALREAGFIPTLKSHKTTVQRRLKGIGVVRVICIKRAILNYDPDAEDSTSEDNNRSNAA